MKIKLAVAVLLLFLPAGKASAQEDWIKMINTYCDSIDKLNLTDSITKAVNGNVFSLIYSMKGNDIVRIEERYVDKHIQSSQYYYIREGNCVFIRGNMEIQHEEAKYNSLELQKVYLKDKKINLYLFSELQFDPLSVYKTPSEAPAKKQKLISKAKYESRTFETTREKEIYKTIENYKQAVKLDNNDPQLKQLRSPFI